MVRSIQSPVGAEIILDDRSYINFGGSSYLGISGKPEILEAGVAALRSNGAGYQFARTYGIASPAHQQAEAAASSFFGTEEAIYLAGGYLVGLVAMAALRGRADLILYDELAHFALRDAIAASKLPSFSYRHLDPEDMDLVLHTHLRPGQRPLVVTDGLFSTFGELAPIGALADMLEAYDGHILIDESHSFGIVGATGRGVCEQFKLNRDRVIAGGSTSKAFGVAGGLIPGSRCEVAGLRTAPAARGAMAGLPAAAAMCAKSLGYVHAHPELLGGLREKALYAKTRVRALGLSVADDELPIIAFSAGSSEEMTRLRDALMAEGIYVLKSDYLGSGAAGAIRCAIFTDHSLAQIDALVDALRRHL